MTGLDTHYTTIFISRVQLQLIGKKQYQIKKKNRQFHLPNRQFEDTVTD